MSSNNRVQDLRRMAKALRIQYLQAMFALRNAQRNQPACARIRGLLEKQLRNGLPSLAEDAK